MMSSANEKDLDDQASKSAASNLQPKAECEEAITKTTTPEGSNGPTQPETVADTPCSTEAAAPSASVAFSGSASPAVPVSEEARLKEQLLRLAADFDNYKKRIQSQGNQFVREWKANFILRFLPVLDHFELGLNLASASQRDSQFLTGFRRVYDQLVAVLAKEGLVRIEVTPRMQFDPSVHECVSHVTSNEYPVNTIIAETRAGYRLDQKLLRSPQVVVSSGPQTSLLQNEKQTTAEAVATGTTEPGSSSCCQSAEQRPPPDVRTADSRDEGAAGIRGN